MGAKQFFRKVANGTKDFFKKGGIAESGLRKVGSSLTQASPVVKEIGNVANELAGPLAGVPLIGGALSSGAKAVGRYAPKVAGAMNNVGNKQKEILAIARANKGDISGIAQKSLESVRMRPNRGIQASIPSQESYNVFDELPFA